MAPRFSALLALSLTACAEMGMAPAPRPVAVAPPAPAATAPARPPTPARAGPAVNYAGRGDGTILRAVLTDLPDGRTRISASSQGAGGQSCAGHFQAIGRFQGNSMVVEPGDAPGCRITVIREGRQLELGEGGLACFPLHGVNCPLSGRLARR